MSVPKFTMRQLMKAGVHFGHMPRRWNPKMKKFIFGERGGVHIIDLQKTVPLLVEALQKVSEVISKGGRVLFVGTKRQASDIIADKAKECGQYYVNHRWLGGMLTNWKTISNSIRRLKDLESRLEDDTEGFTKKELLSLTRHKDKMERALGGIKDMGSVPNLVFVIDTNKELTAIREAKKLGIPVVAIVDTNCDPDLINFPIPGNDDSSRSIELYCDLISAAVLSGLKKELESKSEDIGASEEITDMMAQEAANENVDGAEVVELATEDQKLEEEMKSEEPAAEATPAEATEEVQEKAEKK